MLSRDVFANDARDIASNNVIGLHTGLFPICHAPSGNMARNSVFTLVFPSVPKAFSWYFQGEKTPVFLVLETSSFSYLHYSQGYSVVINLYILRTLFWIEI